MRIRENGTMIGGKYKIRRLIGSGGASCVYLAEDVRIGAGWAVKEIFPERMTGGKNLPGVITEACLLKSLNHPALPRIVDLICGDDSVVIVMDFIEGRPLDRVLASEGPPDEETAVDWTVQIAEILNYLHNLDPPVIYRDLKPANLILGRDGRIRMIDFNAARRYRPGKARDTEPLGTRGYAPPEQYGKAQTDARSDLYALGVTIGEFCGADGSGVLAAAARRCVQKDPSDRFQSAEELLAFLNRHAGGNAGKRKPVSFHLILLTLILSAFFLISGIFFRALSVFTREAVYRQALIEDQTASFGEREERLYGAIRSDPCRTEAYLTLIGLYEKRRAIDESASRRLTECLLENSAALKVPDTQRNDVSPGAVGTSGGTAGTSGGAAGMSGEKTPARSCEILYRAALLQFFAYGGGGGGLPGATGRALAADPLFLKLSRLSPSDEAAGDMIRQAGCFHRICSFLSEYGSNLSYLSDPDDSDLADFVLSAEGCVDSVVSGTSAPSQYAALSLLSEISCVLREYREGIVKIGEEGNLIALSKKMQSYLDGVHPDSRENRLLLESTKGEARELSEETGAGAE
ncbi:MAG: serine/threonine protein kinase [Lachnospiraceae bacterium]|nr:serine/threonine protein kinase [Lachnospiraceae bacterium]MCI1327918.1 serine/threonine protein kinase [Lachnospiraceae bacterium]